MAHTSLTCNGTTLGIFVSGVGLLLFLWLEIRVNSAITGPSLLLPVVKCIMKGSCELQNPTNYRPPKLSVWQ